MRELFLPQREEEIGLILQGIWRATEEKAFPLRIVTNLGIMPRGDKIRPPRPGSPKQRAKLQQRIAIKTGIRGIALKVALDKIRYDRPGEFPFYIDYVERNLQLVGNLSSVFVPVIVGRVADMFGLQWAMWLLALGPLALIVGLPKEKKT
jgi:hypothetical protein